MVRKYPATLKVTLARIEHAADAQDISELSDMATQIAHARGEQMARKSNTRRFGATEEQAVRNIDRKRAVLKVIGTGAMKCRSCAGEHLLVADGTQLKVLNPCAGMVQGTCNSARTFCK
jgi:hypothetical protein